MSLCFCGASRNLQLSEHQHLIISKIIIARSYHFFSGFQSFKHLIELRILTADADFTLHCLSALWRHYVDPFSSCLLVECASWDKDSLLRLAELKVQVICLSCADVGRLLSAELEVCLELALAYFRIDLSDDRVV